MTSRQRPTANFANDFSTWSAQVGQDYHGQRLAEATNGLLEVVRHIDQYDRFELEELYGIVREANMVLQQRLGNRAGRR